MPLRSTIFLSLLLSTALASDPPGRNGEPGRCNDPKWGINIMRIELDTNQWTSDSARQKERGLFLWVGEEWDYHGNFSLPGYPIFTSLSTSFNQTYISTGLDGAKSAPCPPSYIYTKDYDINSFDNVWTFNSSMTCQGYYDLTRNRADTKILSAEEFRGFGSPEDAASSNGQLESNPRFGPKELQITMPHHYAANFVSSSFIGPGNFMYGYVEENKDQVFGLGFNSTILNCLYTSAGIASRSFGLHYGIPSDDDDRRRNGTLVLGGYQKERLQGEFAKPPFPIGKWSLDRKCPLEISVSSMSTSAGSQNTAFTACLELNEPSLVLPSDMIKALSLSMSTTPSSGSNLTLTLSNDLKISIPPDLLNIREMDKDKDKAPILGIPFLTQTYIFADYQTRELNVGLADNEPKILGPSEALTCVEHPKEMGDLGLANAASQNTATGGSGNGGGSGGSSESNNASDAHKKNSAESFKIRWMWLVLMLGIRIIL